MPPGITTSVNSRSMSVLAIEDVERGCGVGGLQHAIAEIAEHLDREGAQGLVVLDDEDGLAPLARARVGAASARRRCSSPPEARQIDLHRRALAGLAVDLHVARRTAGRSRRPG